MRNEKRSGFLPAAELILILAAGWACVWFIRRYLPNSTLVFPAAGAGSALLILAWVFPARARKAAEFCFRYRWAIALALFCFCVCLRLHGSSIGIYDEVFPTRTNSAESTLFGIPRWIRSDEFSATTPKFLSQAANGYRLYSQQMSLTPTNMVLDFYSPVWDWTIIGKPLAWGFLLFGSETGLSWYWCMEVILLFMTALETCLILTGGRKRGALAGAFLISLSPAIQWWVMPHMPPVILYAMALFCIGYRFFTAKGRPAGWGWALLSAPAAIGFALSIFPAFQVPCAYIAVALLAACLRRDREEITFTRRDWPRIAIPAAAAILILGRFALMSREDLSLLLNTVYPGRRVALGASHGVTALFTDISSLFLPYKDITYLNNCEAATYIHFAPLFLVLCPKLSAAMKKSGDRQLIIGKALIWILAAEAAYMLIGIPQWIGEATMLRFCNRMHEVYGWTAALFTAWGFCALIRHADCFSRREKILWPLGYAAFSLLLVRDDLRDYFAQFTIAGISGSVLLPLVTALAFATLLTLAFRQRRRLLGALTALMMLFCGATVNPVERGTGAVTDHPVSAAIAEISEREPESRWLCTDCIFIFSNYVMANGARVLDATNFYPDPEKWAIIDPAGKYAEETNRYANQSAVFTDGESSVELLYPDNLRIHINPETLKELGIRYLFSTADPTERLAGTGITCEYITGQDGYGIWRLEYSGV